MKVYIGSCGIGLAHVGRMLPVADILRKNNVEIVFSTYGNAYNFAIESGYNVVKAPGIMWREKKGELAVRETVLAAPREAGHFLQQYLFEKKQLEIIKPDVIISDSRYSTLLASANLEIPKFYVANQIKFVFPNMPFKEKIETISSRLNYKLLRGFATEVIAPDFPEPYTIGKENLATAPHLNISFVGPIVRKKSDLLPSQETLKESLGLEKNKLLVYGAISGPGESRKKFFSQIMTAVKGADENINFVIVRGEPGAERQEKAGNIIVMNWAEDRYKLLKAADIVIARCGHGTISEIVVYGKPSILVPQPNQTEQEVNARGIERLGIGKIISQDTLSTEKIKNAITEIVSDEKIHVKLGELQKLSYQYDGAKNIAERVLFVSEANEYTRNRRRQFRSIKC